MRGCGNLRPQIVNQCKRYNITELRVPDLTPRQAPHQPPINPVRMTSLWSSCLLTRYNPSEVSTCIQFRSIPINTTKTNSPSHLLPNKQNHTMWIYRHTLPKMHTGVSGLSLSLVHSQWLKFCFYFFFTPNLVSEDRVAIKSRGK